MNNSKGNAGSPGKLKHNLHNLDVFALLPGAGRPPKKDVAPQIPQQIIRTPQRSISLDLETKVSDEVDDAGTQNGSSSENVEVLESITKTRARGPVKRKPSTKKGREALRKSCVDLTFTMDPPTEDSENEAPKEADATKKQSFKDELQAKLLHPPKAVLKQAEYACIEKKPPLQNTVIRHYLKETRREDTILASDSVNSKQNDRSGHSADVSKIAANNKNISHSNSTTNKEFAGNADIDVTNHINGGKTTKAERKQEDTWTYTETSSSIFRKVESSHFDQHKQTPATEERTSYRSEVMFRFGQKNNVENSNSASTRRSFMNDLVSDQVTPMKSETVYESSLLKRMAFINEMIPQQVESKDGNESQQTGKSNEQADASNKHRILEPANSERNPKIKITSDIIIKSEDRRTGSCVPSGRNQNSENGPNFLSFGTENLASGVARRSSFIETDNFASPEFIKEDNLSDEDNEDVFSEKKLPPQSDILKRSALVDDEDEELLAEGIPNKPRADGTTAQDAHVKTAILIEID